MADGTDLWFSSLINKSPIEPQIRLLVGANDTGQICTHTERRDRGKPSTGGELYEFKESLRYSDFCRDTLHTDIHHSVDNIKLSPIMLLNLVWCF
jgi:hypothetical protein